MTLTPIKLHRLRAGRRQIEVALATGIARCRLSEIECGYLQPRPDELQRLAAALGVAAEMLLPTATEAAD